MNCHVVYALIPNEPLEETVRRQARNKAAQAVGSVSHSMAIEDQAVGERATTEQIDDLAEDFIDRRGLWTDSDP